MFLPGYLTSHGQYRLSRFLILRNRRQLFRLPPGIEHYMFSRPFGYLDSLWSQITKYNFSFA